MDRRIAVLSNMNMNFVIRTLSETVSVYETEGYGNELGILMNPSSSYHTFAPRFTFLIMELMELIGHQLDVSVAQEEMEGWFTTLESSLDSKCVYYISDAYLWGMELEAVWDSGRKQQLEQIWQKRLEQCCENHRNVRILPYRQMIERMGEENAFSLKMWYMGKLLLTGEAQKRLETLILDRIEMEDRTAKKVLVLDLDNTLWGGLAGESDHAAIILSEDHKGLAYKNLQRVILQMQKQGVLLAIASKNNEEDVLPILSEHPHMVLRRECFAASRINWKPKPDNIREIAEELNLGLDSFVFWDDNPTERQMVSEMLPEVTVPEFPRKAEDMAAAMVQIYQSHFARAVITHEDKDKTKQYADNIRRKKLEQHAVSFEEYLEKLEIVITRVKPEEHQERLQQLLNKTNQFNLTTQRYSAEKLTECLENPEISVFFYGVSDCFGDSGLVVALLVNRASGTPVITDFVMSCRVMGKQIEYAVLEDVEKAIAAEGYEKLRSKYIPTQKNRPVAELYTGAGYALLQETQEGCREYEIVLERIPERKYCARIIEGDKA